MRRRKLLLAGVLQDSLALARMVELLLAGVSHHLFKYDKRDGGEASGAEEEDFFRGSQQRQEREEHDRQQ